MSTEAVVLVHGLWTGPWVFAAMRARLREAGFATHGFRYASVRAPLDASARALARFVDDIAADTVHLVAHSLGGIVAHEGLRLHPCNGRVVLLGTPWRGSFAAQQLAQLPMGASLRGRCLADWLDAPHAQWQAPNALGIIAGTRGIGLGRLIVPDLPRPNDGAVSVEETRVDGAADSLALPVAHSAMLLSARVARETVSFLRHGRFGIER
ncbi:MAG TPA: alpha/beta fold hydrolase [Rhodocyclaceae bacterium]|nr:alpha/beta fold hydrolase [Rhodocyclaceae bacterium]HMV52779.1 alpha/beta fold hydrolase [Rhodocyclaceae bacterium]HNA03190.1 alpha/beta fold hydrolase [Rhodocyclaceae bacterium]HNB79316.1 alpha/beta fold hydrolase [Rhodocyclaceae bacterium]HNC61824.1 alpha/beta fold hydrolase [Rhodocyclaceae bacterium]